MKVGTICYATSRGLGHLARDFYVNGVVTDFMVMLHPDVPANKDWYPNAPTVDKKNPDLTVMKAFCAGMDAMLFFETPFEWSLLNYCRSIGVRTYLITMYECTPRDHGRPHKYLCPSLLDVDYFNGELVTLPVDREWKLKEHAEVFVHNGGYLGEPGSDGVMREGTETVIRAMSYVKSPLKLLIRTQEEVAPNLQKIMARDKRIEYMLGTVPYDDLYSTADVSIGAQKWNGCSLPLQEAFASGVLVINTDRYPMNRWLPREALVKPSQTVKHTIGRCMEFDESIVNPLWLAAKMDEWYGKNITQQSLAGKAWADRNSWAALKPHYQSILGSV